VRAEKSKGRQAWRNAAAGWAGIILVLSVIPVGPQLSANNIDKAGHFCQYFLLAWLLVGAFRQPARRLGGAGAQVWGMATAYGLFIELIQAAIPWRSADLIDGLANALGAAIGVLAWRSTRKN
jgi:VanZ family protein